MKLPDPGDVLGGKYRLDAVLGEGGFGRVYSATTLGIDRPVAVKVLKPSSSGQDTRARRFLSEVRIIAQLEHPNTLTLFDYGQTEAGILFMVSELVPGEDLRVLMAQGRRFTDGETLHVLAQVLQSLGEAHEAGVLHRDIKPDNVRIFPYQDDPLTVKVLDFGIAKLIEESGPAITSVGNVVGTPRYMSPDQLFGLTLTPASDIYSVGLLGFEMLLGSEARRPADLAKGLSPVLSAADPVAPGLRAVLNRMLQHEAADRYQSAGDVVRDLRALKREWQTESGPVAKESESERAVTRKLPSSDRVIVAAAKARAAIPPAPVASAPASGALPKHDAKAFLKGVLVSIPILALLASFVVFDRPRPEDSPVAPRVVPRTDRANVLLKPVAAAAPDVGPVVAPDPVDGCGAVPPFSGFGTLTLPTGSGAHHAHVYVPVNYDPEIRHPVVLVGYPDHVAPDDFIRLTRLDRLADLNQFLIASPNAGSFRLWHDSSDTEMFRRSLARVSSKLCVDPGRVFALAHGSSGRAVERLSCQPWVAAVAFASYRPDPPDEICKGGPTVPSLVLAPLKTEHTPLRGGTNCYGTPRISLDAYERRWRTRNECGGPSNAWYRFAGSTCRTWDCEAAFVSCRLDGGYGWPGSPPRASLFDWKDCDGEPPKFPSEDVVWSFFDSVAQNPRQATPPR